MNRVLGLGLAGLLLVGVLAAIVASFSNGRYSSPRENASFVLPGGSRTVNEPSVWK